MPKLIYRDPNELGLTDLAEYLGVGSSAIKNWLRYGRIAEPARRGRRRIWTREQADAIKRCVRI